MKRLQEDTMSKMAVLGRGSMRNKQQVCKHTVQIKGVSDLNARLDYSYHYARSFFEFSHLFVLMTNQATSQKTLS